MVRGAHARARVRRKTSLHRATARFCVRECQHRAAESEHLPGSNQNTCLKRVLPSRASNCVLGGGERADLCDKKLVFDKFFVSPRMQAPQ